MARLKIIVPITIGLDLFAVLRLSLLRYATLIIMNLPFAFIGGIVSLWITGNI